MTTEQSIQIKSLRSLDELSQAVDLQRIYWGNDVESLVPAQMMFTIVTYGGHVLAAMDGERMIGVLIGLLGTNIRDNDDRPAMANLLIASKRMVVLPEYRAQGIGYRMKVAQRDLAIEQGIRLVTWTFDPLQAANAQLNLHKLGGIVQRFYPNYFGSSDVGGLGIFGVSDRLRVDWWVTNRRVEERLHGSRPNLELPHYLKANAEIVNPTDSDGRFPLPARTLQRCTGSFALVEIPLNFTRMITEAPELAHQWQLHIRETLQNVYGAGFLITDFLRDTLNDRERGFYLCSYNAGYDFSLN